ncbi:lipase family protein [Paenibacillus sp. P25]|nr:lipase family protein [Paenibacillus sp. P25]
MIIAFRGTEDLNDLIRDLQFDQTPFRFAPRAGYTHNGLTGLYSSLLREPVLAALSKTRSAKTLYVTGHSVGGSLATLCALDASYHTAFRRPVLITFGAPKVGDPSFVRAFNRRIRRDLNVFERNDLVTMLPVSISGIVYEHVESRYSLASHRSSFIGDHSIEGYYQGLAAENETYARQVCSRNKGLCPGMKSRSSR